MAEVFAPGWQRLCVAGALAIVSFREVDSATVLSPFSAFDDSVPDGEVARAVTEGGGAAAEAALVERFARRVFLYGMRHLRDEPRASDLAQDVMITVIERLRAGSVREPDRIGSFILGTARWMARDAGRRERREAEVARAAALEGDHVVGPSETLDVDRLTEALAVLSERERAVVLLTFQEGRSAQEIGQAFGLKPGHVRVIRHRAINRLGELMHVQELVSDVEAM
ncbi:MAG: sigma-70 family RNA polymerase sigma factor [Polyangiales bacterium]